KVCVRRLCGYGDSGPNLFGLRSLQFVSSRSHTTPQPSRKIDFPTRGGSNRILSLIASVTWRTIRRRTKPIHNALVLGCGRPPRIGCREKLCARGCRCRSSLAHTRKRSGKIQILVQGALHDSHEHRIVEARPPTVERRRRKFRLRPAGRGEIMKWNETCGGL